MNTLRIGRGGWLLAAALLIAVLGTSFHAAPARAASQSLDLNLGVGGNYDDNLLQYSSKQRADFTGSVRPDRYVIQSLDDFTMTPTAGLSWTIPQSKGWRHVLRARWTGDFQGRNHAADYHELSFGLREVFHHGKSLSLGFYSLPGYYLRQLPNEASEAVAAILKIYDRAQFDLSIGSAAWDQRLSKNADLEVAYQLEHRLYVPGFKERTSDTHQGKLAFQFSLKRPGSDLTLLGGYRVSKAKATDGDEVGGVADDEDLSYKGPIAGIEGRYEFSRTEHMRWSGDASYHLASRKYDSNRGATAAP